MAKTIFFLLKPVEYYNMAYSYYIVVQLRDSNMAGRRAVAIDFFFFVY